MKIFTAVFCLVILSLSIFAQKRDEVLATATNKTFTASALDEQGQKALANRQELIADARLELFAQQVSEMLLAAEAAARKTTIEKLEAEAFAKITAPQDEQIQAIYDANKDRLGNKSLEQARPQIIAFLRREPEQKALENYIAALKTKHKAVFAKDVNAPNLKPTDVLATVGKQQITVKDFEDKNKFALYELDAKIYEAVKQSLEETIFNELLSAEAAEKKVSTNDIIAAEVSDKMKDFSDEERYVLMSALKNRLYTKYKVNFSYKEPETIAQNISTDDDPSQGAATAPVTIVMFSDFQCPACAAAHPVLKNVIAEYKDKVRFVVRDYPLVSIHENAFLAAQAANAANAQGKFFEYVELLYNNQDKLDNASLKEFATKLGLDRKKFDADLDGEKYADEVRKDMADGATYSVNSTPTIFINGIKIRNNSAEEFKQTIERALKK